MSSDAYAVSPAELTATGARLRAAAGSIATELGSCSGQVRAMAGLWTGGSALRYEALFNEWQSAATRLQHALEGIAEMTGRAAQVYATGDQSVAGMMSAL